MKTIFLFFTLTFFSFFANSQNFSYLNISGTSNFNGITNFNSYINTKGIKHNGEFRLQNNGVLGVKFNYLNSWGCAHLDFNNKMYFRNLSNGNISPLLLQHDGSVVINSQTNYGQSSLFPTQGYKLVVNGGILCEEIKVILDVPLWDVVFEPDYSLMTLYQVDSYIKKNKHLPNIPSAKEFKENGYSLGEMDGMLLRKTEELTLYMIDMRKELDELKKQNEELRKELATKK